MRRLNLLLLPVFVCLTYYTQIVSSTFVDSSMCQTKIAWFKLRPFITDVAIDKESKKLKFFMNSQVLNYFGNNSDTNAAITNFNETTDLYTTFRVKVNYMGRQIIDETKNFCDVVSVKDTPAYRTGPRFVSESINSSSFLPRDTIPELHLQETFNNNSLIGHFNDTDLGSSDSTISELFSNATGELVQCPLYYNDSIMIYYEADISQHFHRFGSYQVTFIVYDNNESRDIIGCSKSYITLIQPAFIDDVINIGVLVLLITTLVVNTFTVTYSSYQESTNPYLFKASTICNAKLLKQGDASLSGIITYLQYALFLGGLDLSYPGFYQPMIGQVSWCALIDFILVKQESTSHQIQSDDGVYVTLSAGGLPSLTQYNSQTRIGDIWPNFMADLGMVMLMAIVLRQLLFFLKKCLDKILKRHYHKSLVKNPSAVVFLSKKNLYLVVGQILQIWLSVFGMPFLVLSLFMFLAANDLNGKHRYFANYHDLKKGALSFTTPYDELRIPHKLFSFGETFATPWGDYITGWGNSTGAVTSKVKRATLFTPSSPSSSSSSPSGQEPGTGVLSRFGSNAQYINGTSRYHDHTSSYLNIPNVSLSLASILLAVWLGLVLFFIFHYLISIYGWLKIKTSSNVSKLYTSLKSILIWSFLYHKYKPQRVTYVIFDIVIMFVNSVIVGALQNSGVTQVSCLIVTSVVELIALFTLKPFFVPITPWSSQFMFPVAKFLCTTLCIPFISSVNASEAVKTYVAYIQLIIHSVVVIIFTTQLIYWLIRTCISIYKSRIKAQPILQQVSAINSQEEFEGQFEYKAVVSPFTQVKRQITNESYRNPAWISSGDVADDDGMSSIGEDEFLFRSRGTRLADINEGSNDQINATGNSDSFSIQSSFVQQLRESELRKLKNDYRVREIDKVYEKYFVNDEIDPEVKELWESRKLANGIFHGAYCSGSSSSSGGNHCRNGGGAKEEKRSSLLGIRLRNIVNKQQPKRMERAFVVSRPRPLIVKTLEEVQSGKQNKQEPDTSGDSSMENTYPVSSIDYSIEKEKAK
ncbi:Transient receptor putative (TRP) ion channel family protein [Candida parapsilosis]|uniref:Transient receptor putative (TRP) ion channel family protein n=1 Tax=Candida parapsilosis TaxID=5480 RepID=A0A8X7NIK7_CANPA|nr:Transient receptor putative (TRP) ion channel family protein [Candida parapsilosis]KAF6050278.1 Transient receptor putative (TRP) ion channel family protein [Candida parapsilosis]